MVECRVALIYDAVELTDSVLSSEFNEIALEPDVPRELAAWNCCFVCSCRSLIRRVVSRRSLKHVRDSTYFWYEVIASSGRERS